MFEQVVSVIVPVYKVEDYIRTCVDAIIHQSYTNLEILLVDDGSPDGCGAICDAYAKQDGRVKVIHKKNGGLSSARNAGMDVASGSYLFFVDSDDSISVNTIETLVGAMEATAADTVVCNYCHVDEDGRLLHNMDRFPRETLTARDFLVKSYDNDRYVGSVVVWNKLYKRELIGALRFPEGKQHEDEFFTYRAVDCGKTVTTVPDVLYNYLQRGSSIMGAGASFKSLDAAEADMEKAVYFHERGEDFLTHRALRHGCGVLAKKRVKLDIRDSLVKKRYRALKRDYFSHLFRYGSGKAPLSLWVASAVFLVSEKLLLRLIGK